MNSNNLVDKFIYGCSHDLRSPVTSIQGLLQLANYYPKNGDVHKCLEMIGECTNKMDTILRKLQEYMMDNNLPLEIHRIDAHELVGKIYGEFRTRLDAYNIQLRQELSTTDWMMDDDIILKILRYLVSNSIAYHDPEKKNRHIIIRIEANQKGTMIEVSDNGLGIPEEQQKNIFDVFYRATENSIGSGMGLFLVKSLAEKAGGVISCQSRVGDGTKIQIYFPGLLSAHDAQRT